MGTLKNQENFKREILNSNMCTVSRWINTQEFGFIYNTIFSISANIIFIDVLCSIKYRNLNQIEVDNL